MKKIGILYGIERSFPQALILKINELGGDDIKAEEIKTGAITNSDKNGYSVIFDRVSDQVPFFATYLKSAVLSGVNVVNNPFWKCTNDNFFHSALATKIGFNSPKSVILPSKEHPEGTSAESHRNMVYPLNWGEIFDYVGFPAYIKPNMGSSISTAYKVYNKAEFFSAYDLTGNRSMILEESIEFDEYYRCFVIGKQEVLIIRYDPLKPLHLRYSKEEVEIEPGLAEKLETTCREICETLDFDFNSIEFAISNGMPYVIDFLNSTPVADKEFLKPGHFDWLVEHTAKFLIDMARNGKSTSMNYNWTKYIHKRRGRKPAVQK